MAATTTKAPNPLAPNRRHILAGGAAGAAAALWSPVDGYFAGRVARAQAGVAGRADLRFRQVHLDFHTSEHVQGIGADFDPGEFAATLKKAHVDSVTVFGRCHHGYIYYDTKKFRERIHPNLARKHLLNEQIGACHKLGIRAPIYITIQWDEYTIDEHPEWRQVTAAGTFEGRSASPFEAGFYSRLCFNTPYADFLKAHLGELFDLVPVDGLFLDIVAGQDCACVRCKREMLKRGLDPSNEQQRKDFGREVTDRWKRDVTTYIRKRSKDCTIFYNGGHIGPHIRQTAAVYSHFELESLPSGGWGYLHFPLTMRYARTLGHDCLGMTGKFHTSWGDFHSLKNQAALEFECFNMLAMGAKCSVGDQLHPRGRLDAATYDLIGGVYASIEKKEPWCKGARPTADIAVLSPEESVPQGGRTPPSARGVVRMLQEGRHQFDVVDSETDLDRYKLLVLPDEIVVSPKVRAKLERRLADGGAIIATYKAAASNADFASKTLGVKVKGDAPFSPDFVRARDKLGKGLPKTELVMYKQGLELQAASGTEILADVVVPYFNRTYKHFFSHKHTPSAGKVGYPGVVQRGRVITFAHPIFTQYALNAPRWCRQLFLNAVDLLLPEPLVRTSGPTTLLATMNEQTKEKRLILHLLHYVPERRGDDFDVLEDVIPLSDIKISVRTAAAPKSVKTVPEGQTLPHQYKNGRAEVTLPKLVGHQLIEIAV